jgi:hypothetical protein
MVDLNTLVPPGSGINLAAADSINDRGEIASEGVLPNGDNRAVLLIPCDDNHPGIEGCDYTLADSAVAPQSQTLPLFPNAILPSIQPRQRNRYHIPGSLKGAL